MMRPSSANAQHQSAGRRGRDGGGRYARVVTTVADGRSPSKNAHNSIGHSASGTELRNCGEPVTLAVGGGNASSMDKRIPEVHRIKNPKLWEIVMLTCFNFPYGLICGTMGLFILPEEAIRLFPRSPSVALGLSLLIVGVSQLICPLAGKLSDSFTSSTIFGRRKPFLLWGSIIGACSVIGMWIASAASYAYSYYLLLFIGMLALNVIYSVQCGLVPDFLTDDVAGRASGIVAVHGLVGASVGFGSMIATTHYDFHLVYPVYAVLVSTSCILSTAASIRFERQINDISGGRRNRGWGLRSLSTMQQSGSSVSTPESVKRHLSEMSTCSQTLHLSVANDNEGRNNRHGGVEGTTSRERRESVETRRPSDLRLQNRVSQQSIHSSYSAVNIPTSRPSSTYPEPMIREGFNVSCADIADAYTIDTSQSYDFFWVFLGRTFYYVGVSVQAFIMFYLRDVVGTQNESMRRMQIGSIALTAQTCAAVIAYPVGRLSDDVKVGKKMLIYVACACMSLVYGGFLMAPIFGPWAFTWVLGTSVLYGAGNGCFLAVDYGLALETLPDKTKTAQALGIWGVAAFIGSAMGPLAWGSLIQFFGAQGGSVGFGSLLGVHAAGSTGGAAARQPAVAQYDYPGYEAMLLGGIAATICAGVMIKFVKKGSSTPPILSNITSMSTSSAVVHDDHYENNLEISPSLPNGFMDLRHPTLSDEDIPREADAPMESPLTPPPQGVW